MSTPLVSVIVPCHDYGRYLAEAVESLLVQDVPLEVLVVDDGSTDDTLSVAEQLASRDPRVRVLAQPCSGQPAIARNNGIARTSAPYVLCLDADDSIQPGFLQACVDALESDPAAGLAYGDQQNFGGDTTFHRHADYGFVRLIHQNFVGTATVFRREAWVATGGYATNVRGYEDWDFWIGCGEHGFSGRHVPKAVFNYRVHGSGLYTDAISRDPGLKARIVLNHPRLYTSREHAWARAVEAGELDAPTPVGVIPAIPPPRLVAPGRHVVAASADELAAHPELLTRYDRLAPPGATLLLHVDSPEALVALRPYAERVAVDVVAVPDATEADIALQSDAVLSRGRPGPLLDLLPRLELAEAA